MRAADEDVPQGRLTRDKLDAVLAGVGRQVGVDVRGAQLIKFTNNAVFRLPAAPVVVRVAGSAAMQSRVDKVVQAARWLADHHAPAVRLLGDVPQPLRVNGQLVTLWHEVVATGPRPTGGSLASILRQFHALPDPEFPLPPWTPFDEIRQRLAEPEGVGQADLDFLLECCNDVEDQLRGIEYRLPPGPIHGDAFLGNLIPGPDGPILCDFDSTAHGPREWDLTPVAVGRLRFDYDRDTHGELASRYGFDVTQWSGFPVLRAVRELKLVTSVVPILRSNPSIRPQWEYRLRTFRSGDASARWSTYR